MIKRFLAAVLCTAIVFVFAPSMALADDTYSGLTVSGGTAGVDYSFDAGTSTLTILSGTPLTLSGTTAASVAVQSGVTANITLSGLNITLPWSGGSAFDMTGATVALTLQGSNSLQSGDHYAGLSCPAGATLTIGGTGSLSATGGSSSAGIGGNNAIGGGTININGGNITAQGGGSWSYGCGAGIGGGGNSGAGGSITISGGEVTATGGGPNTVGMCAAGIGGGDGGDGGTIVISGGTVFAAGFYLAIDPQVHSQDIGDGRFGSGGTLSISGPAAVFLKYDFCPAPTTTTHTHENVTGHTAGESAYGVPNVPWSGDFRAWLRLYTLTYDTNGGSGTAPASVVQHIGTTAAAEAAGSCSKTGYTFAGWNTAPDGSGTSYSAGEPFTFTADTTLYAKWTVNAAPTPTPTPTPSATAPAPTGGAPSSSPISVSVGTTQLYTGGRTTLTPAVKGGTWQYDKSMVSLKDNADGTYTVTALKSGTTTLHYTVGSASADVSLTIGKRALPLTGQDVMPVYILLILAGCTAAAAAVISKKKKAKN